MELTQRDSRMARGLAILSMLGLHLFCQYLDLPFRPLVYIKFGGGRPLTYWFGMICEICVPIYCFSSGYAQALLFEKEQGKREFFRNSCKRLAKFILNFWIALFLFTILGLLFDQSGNIPGSWKKFFGNLFLIGTNSGLGYTGVWWFVLSYVELILLAPVLLRLVNRLPSLPVFLVSGGFYFGMFCLQHFFAIDFQSPVLRWLWIQVSDFADIEFAFIVGMLYYKHRFISRLRSWQSAWKLWLCLGGTVFVWLAICILETGVIKQIVGIVTVTAFHVWNKPNWLCNAFDYLGSHSTNIWFSHMMFYSVLFTGWCFVAVYPIPVFLLLLALSLACSYVINLAYKPLVKRFF